MKFVKSIGSALTCLMVMSGAVFAQDANVTKETEKKDSSDLKISGKVYLQYAHQIKDANDKDISKTRAFQVTRAYITLEKQLSDIFSVKVNADAIDLDDGNAEDEHVYDFFLKNAYLQAKNKFDDNFSVTVQAGLLGTPITGLVDNQSGYRWINNNYIDQSKKMFGLNSGSKLGENSTDLGLNVKFDIMKMVDLTYTVTNGEGYKQIEEAEKESGKAQYAVATIKPIRGIFINGYLRHALEQIENKDKSEVEKSDMYYGGGLGFDMIGVKVGGTYSYGFHKTDGDKDHKYSLMDIYFNANLKEMTEVPVLVYGRFAMGEDKEVDDAKTTVWAFGAGYQFNKHFKAGLYFENYSYEDAANDDERTLYVKAEAKY